MKKLIRTILITLALFAAAVGLNSCSQTDATKLEVPTAYDDELLTQYSELTRAGYDFLDMGEFKSAVAKYAAMAELIPAAKYNEYHMACANARVGDIEKSFEWLQKMADKGWDIPGQLYDDQDFAPLVDDPRFEKIVEQTRRTLASKGAVFAERIPEYKTAAQKFDTEEAFDTWVKEENVKLRSNGRVWFDTQYMAAKIDFLSRKLAAMREMKADDPEFDYGFERVRAVGKIKSPYECWGVLSESVAKEVDAFMTSSPAKEAASEAGFWAGLAMTLKYCDGSETEAETAAALKRSNLYLARVEEGTEYYGPARTMTLANQIDLNPDNKQQFQPEVRQVLGEFADDGWVGRIVTTRFQQDAISMIWPIEIDMKDINGKNVLLDQFKGKVVLLDFWATWCGPCLAELPNVLEAYKTYHSQGFEILSVSLDYEDRKPLDDYRKWIDEKGMNWRHIYDGKGWDAELAARYFVKSIPATFLIGTDGKLFGSGDDCRGKNLALNVEKALSQLAN